MGAEDRAQQRADFKSALTQRIGWLRADALAQLRTLPPPTEPRRRARALANAARTRRDIENYMRVRRDVDTDIVLLRDAARQASVTAAFSWDA